MRTLTLLLAVALVLAGLGVWLALGVFRSAFGDEYERFRSVEIGMSEAEVKETLGEPYKVYLRDSAPTDYYEQGYTFKQRPITSKVFIYIATEPIAYVYLDERDLVEDVFVGGS